MTRYIIMVYARLAGSASEYFDPSMITVIACDDQSALDVAIAEALERGWEAKRDGAKKPHIVRREPLL